MKRPVRIASAALALAAVVAMQFAQAQPAHAQSKPDLVVAFDRFTIPTPGAPGIPRARFGIRNIGGGTSDNILVVRSCTYHDVTVFPARDREVALPMLVLDPLVAGQPKAVDVECQISPQYGAPTAVTVKLAAQDELDFTNNMATAKYPK